MFKYGIVQQGFNEVSAPSEPLLKSEFNLDIKRIETYCIGSSVLRTAGLRGAMAEWLRNCL